MKTEIKAAWLEALRSGDYKQGQRYLAQSGDDGTVSFCCLGVLCDLAVKEGIISHLDETSESYIDGGDPINLPRRYGRDDKDDTVAFSRTSLPSAVMDWAGVDTHNPTVDLGDDTRSLAFLNDSGFTFAQIADFIEEKL